MANIRISNKSRAAASPSSDYQAYIPKHLFRQKYLGGYKETYIPNHHFKVWLQYFYQVLSFQSGARCPRPLRAAVLDTFGDHLLYCVKGSHKIRRHDTQVQLLAKHFAKAARHPVVDNRPLGRHRESPNICALCRTGGTDLFDVAICHPLSQNRVRDALDKPLGMLKAAGNAKVSQYARMMPAGETKTHLLPVPSSTLGWWHSDSHRALVLWQPQLLEEYFPLLALLRAFCTSATRRHHLSNTTRNFNSVVRLALEHKL